MSKLDLTVDSCQKFWTLFFLAISLSLLKEEVKTAIYPGKKLSKFKSTYASQQSGYNLQESATIPFVI